ncbi:S-layer homology domain-containing protein [Paenibacillus sp. OK076]|uniref:S-layer homology domain-containing protein n=1 Tax=Paenibacillus sp. OK076 TaxID=1884379 RepID=UPI0008B02CF6|nr:S-layer homology domain-containing protein [Paenibacillus sp. OK076]SEM72015.1 S-layer homology domain-containing protein [Paenibacillus sp. OK076]
MNQDWKKLLLTSIVVGMLWGNQIVNAADQTGGVANHISSVFTDQTDIRSTSLQAVQEAVKQGLIAGYPDGSFHPRQHLTRREMAVLLAKAAHLTLEEPSQLVRNNSDWATPYIDAIRKVGWMTGDASGNFRANDPIRREELASILVRVTGAQGIKGGQQQTLSDESMVSSWAKEQVHTALKLGLLESSEGSFNSKALVERQDIAGILVDVFQTGERTASLTKLDGDVAYIDGRPFVISKELQSILNDGNKDALQNAVITYDARTRNLSSLSEIQIVQAGTVKDPVTLDLKGSSYKGVISVSADHVILRADTLSQVFLKSGVSVVSIEGDIEAVTVDTTDKVTVQGSGTWKQIQMKDAKSVIQLPETVKTDKVILPKGGVSTQIIRSTPTVTRPSSNTGTSNSNSDSGGSSGPSTPTPETNPPVVIVPPSPVNQPPVIQSTIPDKSVFWGEGAQEIDLSTVFTDADEDELSYEISEINHNIATVDIQGSTLRIQPVALGNTTVTVKATDGKGGSITTSFSYLVNPFVITPPIPPVIPPIVTPLPPINHAPEVVKTLQTVEIQLGTTSDPIDLKTIFSDPDGDELTFVVTSSDNQVASADITDNMMLLNFYSVGSATMTVTAKDNIGAEVKSEFTVEVKAPVAINHKPTVAGQISKLNVTLGKVSDTVSLDGVFEDSDGDILTYTAESSDSNVVDTSVQGETLTLGFKNVIGSATVTVKATDPDGEEAETTFTVKVEDPDAGKGLFISEVVWGEEFNQAIELYNPTSKPLNGGDITIVRSDTDTPITLDPDTIIPTTGTLVLAEELSNFIEEEYYYLILGLAENTEPVTLTLYYKGEIMDTAVIVPAQSLTRKRDTVQGDKLSYEPSEWSNIGENNYDNLGKFDSLITP